MKLSWLALLSVSTAAFCQSPAQQKIDPDKLFQLPDKFTHAAPDFKTLKSLPPMKHDFIFVQPAIDLPRLKPDGPQIDPRIIVRPPWHGPSKGQDVSHNLFPHLKLMPIRRPGPAR